MTDLVLWFTGISILLIFAGTIWINRRRMKAEVSRMSGGNPDFQALSAELRRTNDILEKTLGDHETRLKSLEGRIAADRAPDTSRSLN